MAHGKSWMVAQKRCWPPCGACAHAYSEKLRQQRIRQGARKMDIRVKSDGTHDRIIELYQKYLISANEMGSRTGLSDAQIRRIMHGEVSKVYRSTALKVLALYQEVITSPPTRVAYDPRYVDPRRARLALRGLAAQGYTRQWIRSRIGLDFNTIWRLTSDEDAPKSVKKIMRDTEEKVLQLAREVGSSDGGNTYTRSAARARGWKPTMYYDELV